MKAGTIFRINTIAAIFSILLMLSVQANGNETQTQTPWFVSANLRTGQNKPHRPIVENLTYPYRSIDLKLGWQSIGLQPWQVAYRYPSYGVGLNLSTFRTEVLGNPAALYFFTSFPQVTTNYFSADIEVNLGASLGINPYHPVNNPHNFATGSSFNAFFGIYLENSFHIGKHVDIFASGGLTHYSNGAVGWPNLGLNIPSLKFGVRYQPQHFEKINRNQNKPEFSNKLALTTYLGTGSKKLFDNETTYHEYVFAPSLYYRTSFKRRLGLTYELVYNEAITGIWTRRLEQGSELLTHAGFVSHEYLINRFTILMQVGVYISNSPFDMSKFERFRRDYIISRLGIGYYVTPWCRTVLNLKSHYIKAEYVELGLVFDINLVK